MTLTVGNGKILNNSSKGRLILNPSDAGRMQHAAAELLLLIFFAFVYHHSCLLESARTHDFNLFFFTNSHLLIQYSSQLTRHTK